MRGRSGYTLVELSIALSMVVILLGGALVVVRQGEKSFGQSMSSTNANTKANRALNAVVDQLTGAGADSLAPDMSAPFGATSVRYRTVDGWNGAATWTSDSQILLQLDPAELDNGLDDDGDGFVDECEVVLVRNVGEADEGRTVLVRRVREYLQGETPNGVDDNGNGLIDERGFCLERVDDRLIVRLTVLRTRPDGGQDVQTVSTSVSLRN